MLSYSTIDAHTLELLKALMQQELFSSLRLVGGTSLALQYGHRRSVDLDIFGPAQLFFRSASCIEANRKVDCY